MADYQKMYTKLFNATTDAIKLLQTAQLEAEDTYISSDDTVIHIVWQTGQEEESDDLK